MKKLLSILLLSLSCLITKADFEGLPLATTNYTWASTRSIGVISQLWEAVQERCYILNDSISPIEIIENWQVQDGYSNYVWGSTWTVGTNNYTKVMTNKYAHYVNIVTTNQIGSYSLTISNNAYVDWFVPLRTNNPSATTNITIDFPVTHDFITTLDSKMFEMTPYFVNTNFAINGNFNSWFEGNTYIPQVINANYFYGPALNIRYSEWNGTSTTKKDYYINGDLNPGYSFSGVFTKYYGYPSELGGNSYVNSIGEYVMSAMHFYIYDLPTNFPMHCKASAMKNANIGYVTNVVQGSFTNIISGDAWFTRQPVNTNTWILWQATYDQRDTITLSGSGASDYGAYYDGTYIRLTRNEWLERGYSQYAFPYSMIGDFVYLKETSFVPSAEKFVLSKFYAGGAYLENDTVWLFTRCLANGYNHNLDGPMSYNIVDTNSFLLVDGFEPQGYIGVYTNVTSPLISTNSWRITGNPAWIDLLFPFSDPQNIYGWGVSPSQIKVGCSTISGVTNIWFDKCIGNYDYRFYDVQPKPFWKMLNNTNPLTIHVEGTKFVLGTPDHLGEQAVVAATEDKTLTQTNTPSSWQWYQVYNTNSYVTGNAQRGATVLLMWTNAHSYDRLPYRLYAEDINERVKYLKQLVWTTHTNLNWIDQSKQVIDGFWNGEDVVYVTGNNTTYEEWITWWTIPIFGPFFYTGKTYDPPYAWTNAIVPSSSPFGPAWQLIEGTPWLLWTNNSDFNGFVWNAAFYNSGGPNNYYSFSDFITNWNFNLGTTVTNNEATTYTGEPISSSTRIQQNERTQETDFLTPYYNKVADYVPEDPMSLFDIFYPFYWECKGEIGGDPVQSKLPFSDTVKWQTWDGYMITSYLSITNIPNTNMYGNSISHQLDIYIKTNQTDKTSKYFFDDSKYSTNFYDNIKYYYVDPYIEPKISDGTKHLNQTVCNDGVMPYENYYYTNNNSYLITTNYGPYTDTNKMASDVSVTQRWVVLRYSQNGAGPPNPPVYEGFNLVDYPTVLKGFMWNGSDYIRVDHPENRIATYSFYLYPTGYVSLTWTNYPKVIEPYIPGLDGWLEVKTNVNTYTATNIVTVFSNNVMVHSYTTVAPGEPYKPWPNTYLSTNSILTDYPDELVSSYNVTNTLDVVKTNIYWVQITWDTNKLAYGTIAIRDYYGWSLSLKQNVNTNVTASIRADKHLIKWDVTNGLKRK